MTLASEAVLDLNAGDFGGRNRVHRVNELELRPNQFCACCATRTLHQFPTDDEDVARCC